MWLSKRFAFLRVSGSNPSTVLITPKWSGGTGWNYCEGWVNTLKELNHPCQAFHLGCDRSEIRRLFAYLKKNTPELVILSCGDHHLAGLHDTKEKQEFWQSLKSRSLCFCMERVVNSPFPGSEEKTLSAIKAFDGFIYVDEFAEPLFAASGKPAMWSSQFSDDKLFHPRTPFASRHNQVYFRATLNNFGIAGVYDERRALIEHVRTSASFVIHDQLLSSEEYAMELARQRFVLRAASNCGGYVENFWNALGCGCVVFHQKLPANEVKSIGLVTPGRDFLEYDSSKPAELVERAAEVLKNWPDYQVIGETGRQTFLANYTLRIFLERLLEFANTRMKPK